MAGLNAPHTAPPAHPNDNAQQFWLTWRGHFINGIDTGGDTGGEPPLLLLMGLGGSVKMWRPLLSQLTGRRVVAFDAPGAGRSSLPLAAVSVPALADLSAAVLDGRGLDTADVLGYSYGGGVAQQLAVQHPTRIRKLVLAATTCGAGSQPEPDRQASAALTYPWRYYNRELFQRSAAAVYGGRVGYDESIQRALFVERSAEPPHPYGYSMQLVGGIGWSSLPVLHTIGHTTLVVVGDDDPLVPVDAARMLTDRIPRSRLQVVPGAGHLFLMDEPARAAAAIQEFLTKT